MSKATLKIEGTNYKKVFSYNNRAQLEGLVDKWIESLEVKGKLVENRQYKAKRMVFGKYSGQ